MYRSLIGITMDISGGRLTLKDDYVRAVEKAGGLPLLIPPAAEAVAPFAGLVDGLLIPGGDDLLPSYYGEAALCGIRPVPAERSDFEIRMFHEIILLRKPVLGICYGMQLVNVALGGSLYQDIQTQVKGAIDHGAPHELKVGPGGPIKEGKYMVNSTHHQAVKGLGKGLRVLAASGDGLVEAIYMDAYPFLMCVQWHPERDSGGLSDNIFNKFMEATVEVK